MGLGTCVKSVHVIEFVLGTSSAFPGNVLISVSLDISCKNVKGSLSIRIIFALDFYFIFTILLDYAFKNLHTFVVLNVIIIVSELFYTHTLLFIYLIADGTGTISKDIYK